MLIEKARHFPRVDVPAALEEAAGEGGNGVAVGVDEVREDGCEFDFVIEGGDVRVCVWQERREGVLVVGVDAGDVWVRDDDVWEVPQSLDAVREADGEEGEGEVCGGEEGVSREGGTAVPGGSTLVG
jgi:hypothetical protein